MKIEWKASNDVLPQNSEVCLGICKYSTYNGDVYKIHEVVFFRESGWWITDKNGNVKGERTSIFYWSEMPDLPDEIQRRG